MTSAAITTVRPEMKLLVLSQFFPCPPINGGRQRAYQLIKGLAERHDVDVLSFAQEESDFEHVADLSGICRQAAVVPERRWAPTPLLTLRSAFSKRPRSVIGSWSPAMASMVDRRVRSGEYDAALALTTKTGEYLRLHKLPLLLDNDNIDSAYLARIVVVGGNLLTKFRRKLTWVKGGRYESWLVAAFDSLTTVSEEDRAELARVAPQRSADIHVVPNGVDLDLLNYEQDGRDPQAIISTGALTYGANLDGTDFFCREILPAIRARVPAVKFRVTGKTSGVDTEPFASRGAEFTGFLQDVRPAIAGSAALVVPLRIGGGTRLKILEAMALGTPVVSTTLGAAGLGLVHGETALIADDPQEFAACTVRLIENPALREGISRRARQFVAEYYGWDRSVRLMEDALQYAVDRRLRDDRERESSKLCIRG